MAAQAKILIERAKQQPLDINVQRTIIELIETVIVYKFPKLTRQEIESMLGLNDLKQTKVYQEALEEGEQRGEQRGEQQGEQKAKLAIASKLRDRGFSLEEIADLTGLDIEQVRQAALQ